ncbi:hypothetical protein DSL72_001098 [Monilinia vaccinii-corymbosi]|uniref:Uncharacterized protein n=1 Tax=Monilinia vaccinii-corymbosi TaxID=61207 RepID=A0A8A3P7A8_9HELO|nr:hypothetical protein DSL72_001098 [Monilinia vaccinii-corymbosi]
MDRDAQSPQVVTDHDAQSPQVVIDHDAQSPQVVTYYDAQSLQVQPDYDARRNGLPPQDLREKRAMTFNSDYDPPLTPARLNSSPRDSDASSIAPTLLSTPSFPVDKFAIPTRNDSLASGFPFHQRLYDFGVTHDEWHLFTGAIVQSASLTMQEDWAAWTAGISTGVLSTGLLVFGGPVAGYYTGRSVHRKKVLDKVKEGLMHEGKIRATLYEWNQKSFQPKGFKAWLELPSMKGEVNGEEADSLTTRYMDKKEKKAWEKTQSRFRILIIPTAPPMGARTGTSTISGDSHTTYSWPDTPSDQGTWISEAPNTEKRAHPHPYPQPQPHPHPHHQMAELE